MTGKITRWIEGRGYGFIEPDGGGDFVFVHFTDVIGRAGLPSPDSLPVGTRVSFDQVEGKSGKPKAIHCRPLT
jgi:cold shock protein